MATWTRPLRLPLDDLGEGGFHHAVADAGHERHHGHRLLAGGDARDVSRRHLRARRHRADRVNLLLLLDAQASDGLLGLAEHLARPGMLELAALAEERHLEPRHDALALPDGQRDGGALHLDDVTGDAGKERDDLADDGLQRRRRRARRRRTLGGRLGPREGGNAENRDQQHGRRDECQEAPSLHPGHYTKRRVKQNGPGE
jgi:hypothetical protein